MTTTKPVILVLRRSQRELTLRDELAARFDEYDVVEAREDLPLPQTNAPIALAIVELDLTAPDVADFVHSLRVQLDGAKIATLTPFDDRTRAMRLVHAEDIDAALYDPWEPAEEHLFPIVADLLDDWNAGASAQPHAIQVIGHRWSPKTYEIKNVLARNLVPYLWVDVDKRHDRPRDLDGTTKLPVVVLADGTRLEDPTPLDLGERIGLHTHAEHRFYDLIVVGAGPAGLASAVYGASEGLQTLVVDREAPGGQAGTSSRIENYLGFPQGISGADLARRAVTQAERLGAEFLTLQEVCNLEVQDRYRVLHFVDKRTAAAHAIVIATGVSYRRLEAPNVDRFAEAGVYYGASTTEALSCQGDDVFVVGGANSAGQAAVNFAKYARSVTMLVRGESLAEGMSAYLIEQLDELDNVTVRLNAVVERVDGDEKLQTVTVRDVKSNATETLPAVALFIFIGAVPRTEWLDGVVARDEYGFILTGRALLESDQRDRWPLDREPDTFETSVPGVFAVGDVRANSVKRVASAVGQGAIAVSMVHEYLAHSGA